ncbi:uncharacterized protein LOC132741704 isoform X2 [Ruditapes philippinarum]|uniref:uncharacterized protein LOC132741704 isoform X2 n=1 Tax=Ruditapes philippinarum TaxID=129788 RepID=UPI00295A6BB6|nr:uncharacterized protein LOC132741704 isoform X2 [Ruditapes philippinarum]
MMSGKFIYSCFVLFLLQSVQITASLVCNKCNSSESIEKCQDIIQCGDKQSCFTEIQTKNEETTYTMGCTNNQNCGEIPEYDYDAVSKLSAFSVKKCYECCRSKECNYNLCKHPKPSQCQDDKTIDCAKLNEMFDICKDIHDAKRVCPNFCNLCGLVDGSWADWSQWSACDVTCGNGKHTRLRTCTDPAPAYKGYECEGKAIDSKPCQQTLCPVHGEWSNWSNWSACPVTCGLGMQKRHRNCSNPYPMLYGDHCFGDSVEYKNCVEKMCNDGIWGDWEEWGSCSAYCDYGIRQRSRSCANRVGSICEGNSFEVQPCNLQKCRNLTTCTKKPTYNDSFTNVALGKKVTLSSTYSSTYNGPKMVDGNYERDNVAITQFQNNPYAIVDLEHVYTIYSIYIFNRKDWADRLKNVVVQLGETLPSLTTVATHKAVIGVDCTYRFEIPVKGRYLKIMLETSREYLQITELEVYSKAETVTTCTKKPTYNDSFTNVALGKQVTLSSTYSSTYNGPKMVDGNFERDNVAITLYRKNPYAIVDLEHVYTIFSIYIFNRKDWAYRLKDVIVQLGESLSSFTTVATHKTVIGVDCTFRFEIPVKGRYLKIMLETSGEYLQITELEVYSNTETVVTTCTKKPTYNNSFTNVALGKKVTLSSTYSSTYNGPKMVDGNFERDNVAITLHRKNPYAIVDLERVYTISSIYIFNRKDWAYRLKNVIVQLGETLSSLTTVATHKTVIGVDCTFRFDNPVKGRYLKIMLETSGEYLQITELEVYSNTEKVTTCTKKPTYNNSFTNVALGKKVTLSSTYSSTYNGPKMVDGNFERDNVAITLHRKNPYAIVDLEHVYTISSIYIFNRKDWAYRLKNVIVQLGETLSSLTTVATHKTVIGVDCTFRFDNPVKGRYLKVKLETSGEYLQITELEVYSDTKY